LKPLERLPIGQRIVVAIVIVAAVLIALLIVGRIFGTDEARSQPLDNPFLACQLLQGGIQSKNSLLAAWEIMLLVHVSKTADNIVALPGSQEQQIQIFENGLRRAIKIDIEVRKIIDRVYAEQAK